MSFIWQIHTCSAVKYKICFIYCHGEVTVWWTATDINVNDLQNVKKWQNLVNQQVYIFYMYISVKVQNVINSVLFHTSLLVFCSWYCQIKIYESSCPKLSLDEIHKNFEMRCENTKQQMNFWANYKTTDKFLKFNQCLYTSAWSPYLPSFFAFFNLTSTDPVLGVLGCNQIKIPLHFTKYNGDF